MNVFEIAKEKEKRMADFYQSLAQKCDNESLVKVFNMLAEQEIKHSNVIDQMQSDRSGETETEIVEEVRKIFLDIKKKKQYYQPEEDIVKLYQDVRDFEKENELFYLEMASKEENLEIKNILNSFAQEEHKHFKLMSEIVDYVLKPNQWVENAEFGYLKEDY